MNNLIFDWYSMKCIDPVEEMEDCHNQLQNCKTSPQRQKLFHYMEHLYYEYEIVSKIWDYIQDARLIINRFVKKVAFNIKTIVKPSIEWNGIEPLPKGIQQVYLVRLLNAENDLIWSKIGTTARNTTVRLKEHLRYYYDSGIRKVEVLRLYNLGSYEAEGLESQFRAAYIKKYPGSFKKNDRFINTEFDLEEADKIFKAYMEEILN